MQIVVDGKIIQLVGKAPLPINLLMDGKGRMPGIMCKNLGGSTRRCQQDTLLFQLVECLHQGPGQGCLSGARIPFQEEQNVHFSTKKEDVLINIFLLRHIVH